MWIIIGDIKAIRVRVSKEAACMAREYLGHPRSIGR